MGYKLLGYVVWNGGRWYVRRRFPGLRRKLVIAGGGVAVLAAGAAAFAVTRRAKSE